jgi:hypothetical protein
VEEGEGEVGVGGVGGEEVGDIKARRGYEGIWVEGWFFCEGGGGRGGCGWGWGWSGHGVIGCADEFGCV